MRSTSCGTLYCAVQGGSKSYIPVMVPKCVTMPLNVIGPTLLSCGDGSKKILALAELKGLRRTVHWNLSMAKEALKVSK